MSGGESDGNMTSDAALVRGLFSCSEWACKIDRAVCDVDRMELGLPAGIAFFFCCVCVDPKGVVYCGHELDSLGSTCKRHHVTNL